MESYPPKSTILRTLGSAVPPNCYMHYRMIKVPFFHAHLMANQIDL